MTKFKVRDPDYEARVRESFGRQPFMATIGAALSGPAVRRRGVLTLLCSWGRPLSWYPNAWPRNPCSDGCRAPGQMLCTGCAGGVVGADELGAGAELRHPARKAD